MIWLWLYVIATTCYATSTTHWASSTTRCATATARHATATTRYVTPLATTQRVQRSKGLLLLHKQCELRVQRKKHGTSLQQNFNNSRSILSWTVTKWRVLIVNVNAHDIKSILVLLETFVYFCLKEYFSIHVATARLRQKLTSELVANEVKLQLNAVYTYLHVMRPGLQLTRS